MSCNYSKIISRLTQKIYVDLEFFGNNLLFQDTKGEGYFFFSTNLFFLKLDFTIVKLKSYVTVPIDKV